MKPQNRSEKIPGAMPWNSARAGKSENKLRRYDQIAKYLEDSHSIGFRVLMNKAI
jgi:hypothetical protein